MIEAGKWYKTDSDEDGNMAMYYYILMAKDENVFCGAFFEDGELFEYDIYGNFGHDGLSKFIPPHDRNLQRDGIKVLFEYLYNYAEELV